jgi:hypothetical protein
MPCSFGKKFLLGELERKGNVGLEGVKDNWKVDRPRKGLELIDARIRRPYLGRNHSEHVVLGQLAANAVHECAPLLPRHEVAKLVARVEEDRVASVFDELARLGLVDRRALRRPFVGLEDEEVVWVPEVDGL